MPNKNTEKRIRGLKDYDSNPDFAFFKELQDLRENLEVIKEAFKDLDSSKLDYLKGEDGKTPTKEEVVNLIKPLIPKVRDGKDGKTPTEKFLVSLIKPLIPKPIKGKDGKDADMETIIEEVLLQIPETDYEKIINDVIKQIPRSGEEIRNALELLKDEERLDVSAINGLDKKIKKLEKKIKNMPRGGGGTPHNMLMVEDLTSQCDGATKTFKVPLHRKAIKVEGTQFPVIFRPDTDFTTANYTLTLTSEVGAPQTGQTLLFYYIK